MTLTEVKCIGRYRKWVWISKFHDKKWNILLSGMTLSGTHCITNIYMHVHVYCTVHVLMWFNLSKFSHLGQYSVYIWHYL